MSIDVSDMDIVCAMKLAAFEAGKYLGGVFSEQEKLRFSGTKVFEAVEKNQGGVPDFVTRHDVFSERLVRDTIRSYASSLGVVGEEGEKDVSQDAYILVDPCDGTKNFALGIPYFAVSIAYVRKGEIVAGVVCDPVNLGIYWAAKGRGAFLERMGTQKSIQIKGAQESDPRNVLLITEESYGDATAQKDAVNRLVSLAPVFAGIRKFGSTALDLAKLASGQPIAVLASGVKSWDFAAGAIIAQEAGVFLSDFEGNPVTLSSGDLVASPARPIQDVILARTSSTIGFGNQ